MIDIVILIFIGALGGLLLPAERESGMRRVFSFLVGICILLAICRPIAAQTEKILSLPKEIASLLAPQTERIEAAEEDGRSWVIQYSTENIESGVSRLVENRYGWSEGSVLTEAVTETDADGNLVLQKLILYISSTDPYTVADAEKFITDILACPCEVHDKKEE